MKLRPRILRTLLGKEVLKLKKNLSALMLLGLLVTVALLISLSWEDPVAANQPCQIVYPPSWADSDWIEYLREHPPSHLRIQLTPLKNLTHHRGRLRLPPQVCAIEMKPLRSDSARETQVQVVYHFPYKRYDAIAPTAAWFWATWKQFDSTDIEYDVAYAPYRTRQPSSMASLIRKKAIESVNLDLIATMLLLSVQFFACCHLYVSFSSQDRERGTTAALALAPVSLMELLLAKFAFHLILGLSVSALILVIISGATSVHASSFLILLVVGVAWLCIGTVISSFTKTQNVASMLMFCYMLGGGTLFYLATQFPIFRLLRLLTVENHAVTLLYASIRSGHLLSIPFVLCLILTLIWTVLATTLFARMGWQS